MRKRDRNGRRPRRLNSIERLEARELLAVDTTVSPFDHEQTFLGGGAGYGLYGYHLTNGVPADQREQVYDWLFEDLNMPIMRMFNFQGEDVNDDDDPTSINLEAMNVGGGDRGTFATIYQEALERNPDTIVMAYASNVPEFLSNEDGHHDITKPNFYAEYAEWLYGNLADIKVNYGVDIAMIDLLNEPDLNGKVSRADAALIYANTVPILESLVLANYAEYGIEMPLITGTSNLTNNGGANWLTDFAENELATWDAIDVLTTHLYGNNGFDQSTYETIADLKDADHPLFIQNEMEFGHESFTDDGRLPDDSLDNDLEGALALARATAINLEAGADAFHVFQGNSPQTSGAKSLVFSPWGQTATLRKGYYVFKQMTALQPDYSDVVTDVTTGAPTGFHTYAYNKWGDSKVYVNVVNATGSAEEFTLDFMDNQGAPISFTRVTDYATDAVNDMTILGDAAFASPITEWSTTIEPNSVRTFVVDLTQTGYSIPVQEATYLVEASTLGLDGAPQDDDTNPRTEILVGYNDAGAAGTDRGILRTLLSFDIASAGIPETDTISSGQIELWGYRGTVGDTDTIGFDAYSLPGDFVEGVATWLDPDGDGSAVTGDTTPGGTLGTFLSSSTSYSGASEDFEDSGRSDIFHERVVLPDSRGMTTAVRDARDGEIRFAIDPSSSETTDGSFFGFFDENSNYVPELIVVATRADVTGPTVEGDFRWQTDNFVRLTFSEEIDATSLTASDVVVTNLSTGETALTSSIVLLNQTAASVDVSIRGLTSSNADWRIEIAEGSFVDSLGNGNVGDFVYDFFRLVGDANRDRVVDLADYTVWRDTLGSSSDLRANASNIGDSEGVIDDDDYSVWAANYGDSLPEPAFAASVAITESSTDSPTDSPISIEPIEVVSVESITVDDSAEIVADVASDREPARLPGPLADEIVERRFSATLKNQGALEEPLLLRRRALLRGWEYFGQTEEDDEAATPVDPDASSVDLTAVDHAFAVEQPLIRPWRPRVRR